MFGDKAFEMLNGRLDKVEEHVSLCAQKHEVDEVKRCVEKTNTTLADNGKAIHAITLNLAEKEKRESKRLAWLAIAVVILVPFVEEIKDGIFHKSHPPVHSQPAPSNQTDQLLRELIELQKTK